MMLDLVNKPAHFQQWFGEFISQLRYELDIAPPELRYQPDEIYDDLKQGEVLVRLGGLSVLCIGDEVYTNGEKIYSPHRHALEVLASYIVLTAENFDDALEEPSFLAILAALVNSGYWLVYIVPDNTANASSQAYKTSDPVGLRNGALPDNDNITAASPSARQYVQSLVPLSPSLPTSQIHVYHDNYIRR